MRVWLAAVAGGIVGAILYTSSVNPINPPQSNQEFDAPELSLPEVSKVEDEVVEQPVQVATPPPAPVPEEACLVDHRPFPDPMVYAAGVWMEVSFLNNNRVQSSYRTSAQCPHKHWQSDNIGRPILEATQTLVKRAIRVGHPRNGMLDPKGSFVIPKRCAHPVPKIIHFIWLCSPLSDVRADHVRGFAKNNPNFQIFFWTDAEIPASARKILHSARAVEVKDAYAEAETFQSWELIQYLDKFHEDNKNPGVCVLKSHFFRLEAPLKYGGIYVDMDHVSSRGFDEVGGELWRWPFVTYKVCGANIGNHIFSGDKGSFFLDFAVKVIIERCTKLSSCNVLEGTGPPPFSMSVLRYNASDMAFIGEQFMRDTGLAAHSAEHSWR